MSDDPFAAFKEGQPPTQEAPAAKAAKKPRKKEAAPIPKEVLREREHAKADKPKKTRKPRQAKEMRLPISMLLEIGSLSEEESGALLSIGAGLQKLPKKSRGKITAALSKIFG